MRFTIRDLVWLTLLVAMGLGWWVHARRLEARCRQLQSDLVTQADLVDQFVSVVKQLGCEITASTGEYAKIFVPEDLQAHFREQRKSAPISFTLSAPRRALERNLDGEFDRLRLPSQ